MVVAISERAAYVRLNQVPQDAAGSRVGYRGGNVAVDLLQALNRNLVKKIFLALDVVIQGGLLQADHSRQFTSRALRVPLGAKEGRCRRQDAPFHRVTGIRYRNGRLTSKARLRKLRGIVRHERRLDRPAIRSQPGARSNFCPERVPHRTRIRALAGLLPNQGGWAYAAEDSAPDRPVGRWSLKKGRPA